MPRPTYDVHPSIQMMVDWIATLKDKTGRDLPAWLAHIKKAGPKTEEGRRDWLKAEHKLGTNTASWLAERSVGKGEEETPEGYRKVAPKYVDAMYEKKSDLRPLHDAMVAAGRELRGVKICPCQTIVPMFREHVIAQIKPSTKTRIDFGLALGKMVKEGKSMPPRLIDTGGFEKKDRITHRIEVKSLADIDADLKKWLRTAWQLDAPE